MKPTVKPTKTRVFRSGNSQAIRIPKSLELPEGEVYIERRQDGLFISTLRNRWDLFFAEPGVEFPFDAKELRDDSPPRDVSLGAKGKRTASPSRKPRKSSV